jgi:hypothetical protein
LEGETLSDGTIRTQTGGRKVLLYLFAVILLVVVTGFVASKLFMKRVSVRSFQMNIAPDGKVPWGEVGPEWDNGPAPVVLYRQVGDSYCYTALRSPELRDRTIEKSLKSVHVEYNVFSNFGRVSRYTLRTVEGESFAIGNRVIRETEEFGGQVLMDSSNPPPCF